MMPTTAVKNCLGVGAAAGLIMNLGLSMSLSIDRLRRRRGGRLHNFIVVGLEAAAPPQIQNSK